MTKSILMEEKIGRALLVAQDVSYALCAEPAINDFNATTMDDLKLSRNSNTMRGAVII